MALVAWNPTDVRHCVVSRKSSPFSPFIKLMKFFLSPAVGASEGVLVQDCRQKWRGEWDDNLRHCQLMTTKNTLDGAWWTLRDQLVVSQTTGLLKHKVTPVLCFCTCSQQKSPEPDGSVAVNEEGKRRKMLVYFNWFSRYLYSDVERYIEVILKIWGVSCYSFLKKLSTVFKLILSGG